MEKAQTFYSAPISDLSCLSEIGVNNKKAYMNFIEKFSGIGAEFIWSTNVVLDNEVIVRHKVE